RVSELASQLFDRDGTWLRQKIVVNQTFFFCGGRTSRFDEFHHVVSAPLWFPVRDQLHIPTLFKLPHLRIRSGSAKHFVEFSQRQRFFTAQSIHPRVRLPTEFPLGRDLPHSFGPHIQRRRKRGLQPVSPFGQIVVRHPLCESQHHRRK